MLDALAAACGSSLLDRHIDPFHHRSVFTLAGPALSDALHALARCALERIDLREHEGVHPRLGVLDVVPFVPLAAGAATPADLDEALGARDAFAAFAERELELPCVRYGPEVSLPELRRRARLGDEPGGLGLRPHPSAGICCVGARPLLVAYNLVLEDASTELARRIATAIRSAHVRALAFATGAEAQVSCNLVAPLIVGPAEVYDAVRNRAEIRRAELVGLLPQAVLDTTPRARWSALDLAPTSTIERRLANAR